MVSQTPQAEPFASVRALKKARPLDALDALCKLDSKALGCSSLISPCADGACEKKIEYYIMYFPVDEALSKREQLAWKETFSMKMM